MARGSLDSLDPLAFALAPRDDETADEKQTRLRDEAEAKRVSDAIDEQLKAERVELKKKKQVVRVLLLGQAESGTCNSPVIMLLPN
jgi:hypothetical protein